MKKFTTLALALVAVLTLGAVAFAQTAPLTVEASGSPSKAGTKKKPRNSSADVKFTVDPSTKVTLESVEYTFPSTVKVSGKGYPTCSVDTIASEGETACSSKSKVGSGTARAFAGTTQIDFTYNIYAASATKIVLALKSNLINTTFEGKISGRTVTVEIPPNVQAPVPGLYSTVESIDAKLGAKSVKKGKGKKKKTYSFVSTNGCKGGEHEIGVKLNVSSGGNPLPAIEGSDGIPCKK